MENVQRIALIGFSGTGKSTVARLLAERLSWTAVDLDDLLVERFGMSIPEIFTRHGEGAFREAERSLLAAALARDGVVIATGGGAVVDPAAWTPALLNRPGTLVVALDAEPERILARLSQQQASEGAAACRPLLAGDDPLARIRELKAKRQTAYDRAAITLIVDAVTPHQVAEEIADLLTPASETSQPQVLLDAPSGRSEIFIGSAMSALLGAHTRSRYPAGRRAWVITDENVAAHHAAGVSASLQAAGFDVRCKAVPPGEGSKSLATAGMLYDWLLGSGVERGDVVIALGGGVIGDLAGFVAATVLRGIGLVQVPTSLLAMVDSSVGGKTGINHTAGKNLIGAFYQPPLVIIDPRFLQTLPRRELVAGWAEVIKHAVIQPSTPGGERADLLRYLERNAARLTALHEPATTYAILRNVALKATVVQADERESGIRSYLNFGHTLGHAIEAAGYHLLHGEAVALGMRAAMRIGQAHGTTGEEMVRRVDALIHAFGLPLEAPFDEDSVLQIITRDKKRVAGTQRWVLPLSEGGVCIRTDVRQDVIRSAMRVIRAT
jgi:shikimate kinase/3-dehydroquinate synthase